MALVTMLGASAAHAQDGKPITPRGNYSLVADSGYAGPDLTGFVAMFGDDTTMVIVSADGSLIVKSKLVFDKGTMTLNDVDGSNVCQFPGKYKVTGTATLFKLVLVEDGCGDRSAIVVGLKWVKLDK